jgi:hypothetical protein
MTSKLRSRLVLLLLAVLFLAPPLGAWLLHRSGWEPTETRNRGELLQPPVDVGAMHLQRADGTPYDWEPAARRWRVVVVAPTSCATACVELIAGLDKVWQLQGRRADRLDVLWFGAVPDGATRFRRFVPMQADEAFAAALPDLAREGAPNAYLIDPRGFVALRYAPGFDVAHLREDVAQLLKH